jgi:hypothetical protein
VDSHPSASLRAGSFAKCAKDGPPSFVVAQADSRFLTGLSARFGMTRFRSDIPIFPEGWLW